MPQAAVLPERTSSIPPFAVVPRGIDPASEKVAKTGGDSVRRFFARSRSLRSYMLPLVSTVTVALEPLAQILVKLAVLTTRDVSDAFSVDPVVIKRASAWIIEMYFDVYLSPHRWIQPNVTANAEGEVVFEWWNDNKKVTVYITDDGAEYVRVWGPDINTDMSEGEADSSEARQSLWTFLVR